MPCLDAGRPKPPGRPKNTDGWWSILVGADPEVLEAGDIGSEALAYLSQVRESNDRYLSLLGDVTRNGSTAQMDVVKDAVSNWANEDILWVRGNSELANKNDPDAWWIEKTNKPTTYVEVYGNTTILVADTSKAGTSNWEAQPCAEELDTAKALMSGTPENNLKVMLTHVPIWQSSAIVQQYRDMKENSEWSEFAKEFDLIVGGHLHYNSTRQFDQTWQIITIMPTGDHIVPLSSGEVLRLWFNSNQPQFGIEYINLVAIMLQDNQPQASSMYGTSYKPNFSIKAIDVVSGGENTREYGKIK